MGTRASFAVARASRVQDAVAAACDRSNNSSRAGGDAGDYSYPRVVAIRGGKEVTADAPLPPSRRTIRRPAGGHQSVANKVITQDPVPTPVQSTPLEPPVAPKVTVVPPKPAVVVPITPQLAVVAASKVTSQQACVDSTTSIALFAAKYSKSTLPAAHKVTVAPKPVVTPPRPPRRCGGVPLVELKRRWAEGTVIPNSSVYRPPKPCGSQVFTVPEPESPPLRRRSDDPDWWRTPEQIAELRAKRDALAAFRFRARVDRLSEEIVMRVHRDTHARGRSRGTWPSKQALGQAVELAERVRNGAEPERDALCVILDRFIARCEAGEKKRRGDRRNKRG